MRTTSSPRPPRPGCGCGRALLVLSALCVAVVLAVSVVTHVDPPRRVPISAAIPPPPGTPAPAVDINASGRTSEKFHTWAQEISASTGIPISAVAAYANADVIARKSRPECHLDWTTLAGLGYVETRHGSYTGTPTTATIGPDGVVRPTIVGIVLDGSPGFENIPDTDGGALDGDTRFDRAVGPLQFIPTTWAKYGVDASGDGIADPNNIDDAAAGAMRLLCADQRDLSTEQGWRAAIMSYNNSTVYLNDVRVAAANYAVGQPPA